MVLVLIAILGLFVGSFINATALRYDPERFVLSPVARGRSHCPHCKRDLRWFELLPLVSFILQRGRCRRCGKAISWQYPLSELLTAAVFFLIAWRLVAHPLMVMPVGYGAVAYGVLAVWLAIGALLVLAGLIDLRVRIIPDEVVLGIAALGILLTVLGRSTFGATDGSFLGSYALIFGLRHSIWLNHLGGLVFGGGFFGALYIITRGRGIGLGDAKLGAALGLAFGWPDIALVVFLSFVIGTILLIPVLIRQRLRMRSVVAFGPFIVLASIAVLGWGSTLMHGYFSLFGLL